MYSDVEVSQRGRVESEPANRQILSWIRRQKMTALNTDKIGELYHEPILAQKQWQTQEDDG